MPYTIIFAQNSLFLKKKKKKKNHKYKAIHNVCVSSVHKFLQSQSIPVDVYLACNSVTPRT
jgi:hypothetical protein